MRVRVHVSFVHPVRLGPAQVSEVGLELDHLALISDGVVVLEVPGDTIARVEVVEVLRPAVPARPPVPVQPVPAQGGDGADQVWLSEDLNHLVMAWNGGTDVPELQAMFRRSRASILAGLIAVGVNVPDSALAVGT
jgi:hypothetical protein